MSLFERQAKKNPWATLVDAFIGSMVSSSLFDSFLPGKLGRIIGRLRSNAGFVARYAETYKIYGPADAAGLLVRELRPFAKAGRAAVRDLEANDEVHEGSAVERVSVLCMRGYTSNQLLRDIDAVSMSHSLEVRVPFLDVPLIDLSLSLPAWTKIGPLEHIVNAHAATYEESGLKRILMDVGRARQVLPDGIEKQPKRGFTMPFEIWLRGPLRDIMEETVSQEAAKTRGYLDPAGVGKVKQDFLDGKADWTRPWLLMMIEMWFQTIADKKGEVFV
jgi:asparagine synthase (glutamine-hydrolysing)